MHCAVSTGRSAACSLPKNSTMVSSVHILPAQLCCGVSVCSIPGFTHAASLCFRSGRPLLGKAATVWKYLHLNIVSFTSHWWITKITLCYHFPFYFICNTLNSIWRMNAENHEIPKGLHTFPFKRPNIFIYFYLGGAQKKFSPSILFLSNCKRTFVHH